MTTPEKPQFCYLTYYLANEQSGQPGVAREPGPRRPFDVLWKFESSVCAPAALSGRVGALDRIHSAWQASSH